MSLWNPTFSSISPLRIWDGVCYRPETGFRKDGAKWESVPDIYTRRGSGMRFRRRMRFLAGTAALRVRGEEESRKACKCPAKVNGPLAPVGHCSIRPHLEKPGSHDLQERVDLATAGRAGVLLNRPSTTTVETSRSSSAYPFSSRRDHQFSDSDSLG